MNISLLQTLCAGQYFTTASGFQIFLYLVLCGVSAGELAKAFKVSILSFNSPKNIHT